MWPFNIGSQVKEATTGISSLYTTDKERLEKEKELLEVLQKLPLNTQDLMKEAIKTNNFFFYGWPSLVGWSAGACVALYYIPQLFITNYIWMQTCFAKHIIIPFPMAPDNINNLLYLLFGFGSYHLIKHKIDS